MNEDACNRLPITHVRRLIGPLSGARPCKPTANAFAEAFNSRARRSA